MAEARCYTNCSQEPTDLRDLEINPDITGLGVLFTSQTQVQPADYVGYHRLRRVRWYRRHNPAVQLCIQFPP